MNRLVAIVRESVAIAWSQPVASVVSIVMIAGMCATVLLTAGRTVGAEQSVLSSIDSAGTRSIIVRADPDAELDSTVMDRISTLSGTDWVGAFGAAEDAENQAIPGSTRVPVRFQYGDPLGNLAADPFNGQQLRALASSEALEALGMADGAGSLIEVATRREVTVVGELKVPAYLDFLNPLVVVRPPQDAAPAPIAVVVVIARTPEMVAPLARAVQSVLGVDDPSKVKITTSEELATLRSLVQGQLGSYGRNLVIVVFAITAILVAAILYGLVMLRRKDFGRRRALGATRGLIVSLLLVQMAGLSCIGAVVGSLAAAVALSASGDPLPGPNYFAAIGLLAVSVGVLAALAPAVAASRRDPLKELRVP